MSRFWEEILYLPEKKPHYCLHVSLQKDMELAQEEEINVRNSKDFIPRLYENVRLFLCYSTLSPPGSHFSQNPFALLRLYLMGKTVVLDQTVKISHAKTLLRGHMMVYVSSSISPCLSRLVHRWNAYILCGPNSFYY